jgi:hypothetical protein
MQIPVNENIHRPELSFSFHRGDAKICGSEGISPFFLKPNNTFGIMVKMHTKCYN